MTFHTLSPRMAISMGLVLIRHGVLHMVTRRGKIYIELEHGTEDK